MKVLLFYLILTGSAWAGDPRAAGVPADVVRACTPDAMRLCLSVILFGQSAVKDCMLSNWSQVSLQCKTASRKHYKTMITIGD